ncbi:MAG: hypothetical protein Ct9H300mP11_33130 [Chloroflexota bacterium]|nr:MAG: hypothetical protein Ct9H300mP11_33130 [Chloroflexota bacterium]
MPVATTRGEITRKGAALPAGRQWRQSNPSSRTGIPRFTRQWSHIYDVSGNEYVDWLMGSGPMILGHAYPAVTRPYQSG